MKRQIMRILAIALTAGLAFTVLSAQASPAADAQSAVSPTAALAADLTESATAAHPPMIFGWVHIGPGVPVVDATVRITTRRGVTTNVVAVQTGLNGEFSLDVSNADLPRVVVVESRGGVAEGRPWRGRLRSVIDMGPQRFMVHVNAATTMAATWQLSSSGRSQVASFNRARDVLRVERFHSLESGQRLGTTPLDGSRMLAAIERRGWPAWLRSKVRLMNTRQPGPIYGQCGSCWTSPQESSLQTSGIGSIAGSLVWNSVLAAAKGCDPSDSSIPGLGYLATTLASYNIVSQDPSCKELPQILADLQAIEQGITQIETALQQSNDNIIDATNLIKVDTFSIALQQLQNEVLTPIQVGQAAYTNLTNAAQTTVSRVGLPLNAILTSTDDTVVNDPSVQQLRLFAANMLTPAGALGTTFADAANSLVKSGTISDGGLAKGILNLAWEAVRTLSVFVNAQQLAIYNELVGYIRQTNANAAALTIDVQRFGLLTSDQITANIDKWSLPDAWFDSVTTELLPCPTSDDTLNGFCYPLALQDGGFETVKWDYRGPVIDADSGLMWASVCAIDGMPVTDCDVSGILTFAYDGENVPQWFEIPVTLAWSDADIGGWFTRPTNEQVATLKAKAVASSQQPASMNRWLSEQGDMFAQVAAAPIATSGVAWDCGWGETQSRPDLDYIGTFYYACDIPNWCYATYVSQCQKLNRIGLQHTAYVVGSDVTGVGSRIGWALPNETMETNLLASAIPFSSPPTALTGPVYSTDNAGVESVTEKITSAPPTQSEARMAPTAAPLVVSAFDVTPYVVDNWFVTN